MRLISYTKSKYHLFIFFLVISLILPAIPSPHSVKAESMVLPGPDWLSGGGVDVMASGDGSNMCISKPGAPATSFCPANTTHTGTKWVCVELVSRLYLTKGWITTRWQGSGNTLKNYVPAGLTLQNNGSISYVNPGDVVTYNNINNTDGHAAIVDSFAGNTANIINQNGSLNSTATISSGSLSNANATFSASWSGFTVQAIIHAPTTNPPTPPGNEIVGSGVVQMESTGFTRVFAEGPNHSLVEYYNTPGQPWVGPLVVAGNNTTYSAPSAVIDQTTGFTQVVAQGPNNSLRNYWNMPGQSWGSGTADINGTTYSTPSATYTQSTDLFQVFNQGPNNSLKSHWNYPGQSWGSQNNVGGTNSTYSAPAAAVNQNTGFTQVVAQGPNNSLNNYWNTPGQSWGAGTADINGTTYSAPAVVYRQSTGHLQVFAEGPSNTLKFNWNTAGNPWQGQTIGGNNSTYFAPSAVVNENTGFTQVVAKGPNSSLYNYWNTPGQAWGGPSSADISSTTYSAPVAVYQQSSTLLQVFNMGPSNSLKSHWNYPGQSWGSQNNVGGPNSTYSAP